jgi:cellulose synthase/poly-beta-1,6-N-acetylglucosamine synthase-like glycosyltransferase
VKLGAPADWLIAAIVPAHDEEATIESCIDSIRVAAHAAQCLERMWMVVVADDCSDQTALRARRALGSNGEVVVCRVRSAGMARRLGAEAALRHFTQVDPRSVWLVNTDADTRVAADWITVNLALAAQGVVGIAGIVTLDLHAAQDVRDYHLRHYPLGADGTHSHVHGANIAVRADAYLDIGGWSALRLAEDHCLWNRLKIRGWKLSSTVNSIVVTSSRLRGRAHGGFADTLRLGMEALHVGA